MQTKILTFLVTLVTTILKFDSALAQVKTQTELGKIITTSVHCLYCNPGWYPHGLIWYAIVIPIAYFGNPTSDLIVFATVDMAILVLLSNRISLFIPFYISTFISFFVIPQNEPVLWLILLGIYSPYLLAIPVLAKLPVGSELFAHPWNADWNYIFHTSLQIGTNYQWDYGVLVGFWLYILIYYYRVQLFIGMMETWMRLKHKKF